MRPHGKYANVNAQNPEALAVCDRCGFWRNMNDLVWQDQWSGQKLYNIQVLVCKERCYDTPQEQLRSIILPPDPPPVLNARVPDFEYEEQTPIILQPAPNPLTTVAQQPWGQGPATIMCDQTGEIAFVLQYPTSS